MLTENVIAREESKPLVSPIVSLVSFSLPRRPIVSNLQETLEDMVQADYLSSSGNKQAFSNSLADGLIMPVSDYQSEEELVGAFARTAFYEVGKNRARKIAGEYLSYVEKARDEDRYFPRSPSNGSVYSSLPPQEKLPLLLNFLKKHGYTLKENIEKCSKQQVENLSSYLLCDYSLTSHLK